MVEYKTAEYYAESADLKYEKKDYVKVYKNIHNEKYYALNEEGILFLNPLLESLL